VFCGECVNLAGPPLLALSVYSTLCQKKGREIFELKITKKAKGRPLIPYYDARLLDKKR
jgi:hypothetical protein